MSKTMIDNRIFNDSWFFSLSAEAKLLFLFLITNESCSLTGFYEIPLKIISTYTAITEQQIKKLFLEFENKAAYENGWVIIPNYERHNPMNNPNIEKSRNKQLASIPQWVLEINETLCKGLGKGLQTLQGYETEMKRKEKETERKESELKGLDSLTDEFMQQVAENYQIPLQAVLKKRTDLILYCRSTGKKYKDYRAAIQNWIRKDL